MTNMTAATNNQDQNVPPQERMKALISTISAYIEHYHGGAVEMVSFDDEQGTLRVKLLGACEGCDLAQVTLHGWVEGTVKQFFPDVQHVEAVES